MNRPKVELTVTPLITNWLKVSSAGKIFSFFGSHICSNYYNVSKSWMSYIWKAIVPSDELYYYSITITIVLLLESKTSSLLIC
jgi:hypothetical protein